MDIPLTQAICRREPKRLRDAASQHLVRWALLVAGSLALSLGGAESRRALAVESSNDVMLFDGVTLNGWVAVESPTALRSTGAPTWQADGGVLRCSGWPYGYLRTTRAFRDYQLELEWRWVGAAGRTARDEPWYRNSGVLLHLESDTRFWPWGLEVQLAEGRSGALTVIGIENREIRALRAKLAARATDPEDVSRAWRHRHLPLARPDTEKPVGEWNQLEIRALGDSVTTRVNGTEQGRATGVTVVSGFIALQSEGTPVEFRRLRLTLLR